MTQTLNFLPSSHAESLMKEAYELDDLIKIATQELNRLQFRKDSIIEELLIHRVKEAGNYQLIQKVRTIRKIDVKRFRECFPVEFEELKREQIEKATANAGKTIFLKDAERLIGTEKLDPVCDLQSSFTNIIVKKELDGTEG
jgi:hypothetical protein